MRRIALLFAAICAPSISLADVTECLNIADNTDRLACYDDAAGYQAGEADGGEPADPANYGDWDVKIDISKFDDSQNVFLHLSSSDQTTCPYKSAQHEIWIACRENTTNLWIWYGGCFMSSLQGKGRVTYRFDAEPAQKHNFRESNDNHALGLWSGGQAIPFIKRMLGHEKMLVRATPFSDSTVTAEYNISGLDAAIEPLRKACNW